MAETVGSHAFVPRQATPTQQEQCFTRHSSSVLETGVIYPLLDDVCLEIDDRLLQSTPRYSAQFLVPSKLQDMCCKYGDHVA